MSDKQLLEYAIKELDRICMGAGDYLYDSYGEDDTYYVPSNEVVSVLRVLKGWDKPKLTQEKEGK